MLLTDPDLQGHLREVAAEQQDDACWLYTIGSDLVTLASLADRFKGRPGHSIATLKRRARESEEDWSGLRNDFRAEVAEHMSGRLRLDPQTGIPVAGPGCPEAERTEVEGFWRHVFEPLTPVSEADYNRHPGVPRAEVQRAHQEALDAVCGPGSWASWLETIEEQNSTRHRAELLYHRRVAAEQARILVEAKREAGVEH